MQVITIKRIMGSLTTIIIITQITMFKLQFRKFNMKKTISHKNNNITIILKSMILKTTVNFKVIKVLMNPNNRI